METPVAVNWCSGRELTLQMQSSKLMVFIDRNLLDFELPQTLNGGEKLAFLKRRLNHF
jgi:hypothetical protein